MSQLTDARTAYIDAQSALNTANGDLADAQDDATIRTLALRIRDARNALDNSYTNLITAAEAA